MTTNSATTALQHYLSSSNVLPHVAFERLREQGDPQWLLLRTLLESSSFSTSTTNNSQELLFHCITGCRQLLLQTWSEHSSVLLQTVRQFFLSYGCFHTPDALLRKAALTTCVAFWKRDWCTCTTTTALAKPSEHAILTQLQPFVTSPILTTPHDLWQWTLQQTTPHTALFWMLFIGECSGKSSVSYRLPLEFHKQVHKQVEQEWLLPLLQWTLQHCSSAATPDTVYLELLMAVLTWEFGVTAWSLGSLGASTAGRTLLKPPFAWRDHLVTPNLCRAVLYWEQQSAQQPLLRQLLILLASLSGPIFQNKEEKQLYASVLMEGAMQWMQSLRLHNNNNDDEEEEDPRLLDTLQLASRIWSNFKLEILTLLPHQLTPLLQAFEQTGNKLLQAQLRECEQVQGDVDAMVYRESREEALAVLLEGMVLLCSDPWLLYTGTEESRLQVQQSLSQLLGPLYRGFVSCRTRMAALEEHYLQSQETHLDAVTEEIIQADLDEELASIATLGRLDLLSAIQTLSELFHQTMPPLEQAWSPQQQQTPQEVTPEVAALLEQARWLNLYIMHLLTDPCDGEDAQIPMAVVAACRRNPDTPPALASAIQAVLAFAQAQAQQIAQQPHNRRLSPLLACSFLEFMIRFVPAYLGPDQLWFDASSILQLCGQVCLYYHLHWPHEPAVQEHAGRLWRALAIRGPHMRQDVLQTPAFQQLMQWQIITLGIRHSVTQEEFAATLQHHNVSMEQLWGYHRLPYLDKRRQLTGIILMNCDERADQTFHQVLSSVQQAWQPLQQQRETSIHVQEQLCLCVHALIGVTEASEMKHVERLPQFLTPYLSQLSFWMEQYASDLTISELILQFFRLYAEQFIVILNREQSLVLFDSVAKVLHAYAQQQWQSRAIVKTSSEKEHEEEQQYSDIVCALQLLIQLSTKDFVDVCKEDGVESHQVTHLVFFGVQQLLPLMTQGLLQLPTLCSLFYELIGFLAETYPAQLTDFLSYELFHRGLLEAIWFGCTHHSHRVAKLSLYGLGSLAKEHARSQAWQRHLQHCPTLLDDCREQLLTRVIFQTVVTDRVEAAGMALLPLLAADPSRTVFTKILSQVSDGSQRERLEQNLQWLLPPMNAALEDGYEGRRMRAQFRERFDEFVQEVHSFLVLR
ncbi:hypothetical protein FisN_11Lh336 [Fistulifera solaris]|uniref:Exportin-4 n=1 Tax=Fistulifera solaris TaxID=1519565 RepID=A0A1Z5K0H0_FISSO|nr:hypothetical protein FisN_11Lh336 [Fistulifera solaris]|eukprot:GAX19803.1 hypothetical protein FisN_11Lh336 [Fistulifera solaris]